MSPRSWLRQPFARTPRTPRTARRASARGLAVEALEDRRVPAALITVNTLADTVDTDPAVTSLREALTQANGEDGDTIDFSVTGTINLTGALPELSSNMTIQGPGAASLTVRRDTGGSYSVFKVASGTTVELSGLTLANGDGGDFGGGLYNDGGTATLTGVTFTSNTAITGGGFANRSGTATLTDVTFTSNSAIDGAGLFDFGGTATLTNDTFSTNSALRGGGGLYNDGGTATLTNDTFTSNSAGTGGGGLANFGTATLYNTIIAGNFKSGSSYSTSPDEITGTVTGTNNLIGDPSSAGGLTDGTDGNIVGVGGASAIPLPTIFVTDTNKVPVLADYGGPTETVALAQGSPAHDNASANVPNDPATDQRGAQRGPAGLHAGAAPDIGAFEDSSSFLVTSTADSGGGTLRAAVGWANVNVNNNPANLAPNTPAPNTVVFDKAGVFATPQTIALTTVGNSTNLGNSALAVTGTVPVVIDGGTASGLTIARSGAPGTPDFRIVYVAGGANLTLNDLTLSGGLDSSGNGGGGLFNNGGTVTLTGDTVSGNSATGGLGGGLGNVTGGTATLTNDTFTNNSAGSGGGLGNHGTATLYNDTFTDNSANTGGGFDNASGSTATLTNDTFTNNSAGSGGGLFNDGMSTATLYNTIIAGNFTSGSSYSASPDEIAGTVTGSNNLIGDPNTAGGLTDGADGNIVGVAGTSPMPLGTVFVTDTNGIPVLANYGGPTATVALAPGSPAIDKASPNAPNYPSKDQRGQSRVGTPDIGAFESQGFHLAISGGDGQVTPVGQPFGSALTVIVTANDPIGTLNNGTITFTAPGSGASATLSTTTATVVNGMASVTATANAISGSYQVTAASTEANTVAFNLTNEDLPPVAGVSGPTQGLVDQVLTYTLTASDTPAFPTYTFVVNWGDNTSTTLDGASGVTVTHVYAAAQPSPGYTITVAATNPDQITSVAAAAQSVVIQPLNTANLQAALSTASPGSITLQPTAPAPLTSILTAMAGLGAQASTTSLIVSLPTALSPYPAITANLPAGLSFTLNGNGSTVNGNVNLSQPGGARTAVNNLNVTGNLQIQVGNAAGGSAAVAQANVTGNVQVQAGNGDADVLTVSGLSVGGNAQIQAGNGIADLISADALVVGGNLQIQTGNGAGDYVAVTAVSGPTTVTGNTQIHLGNGANNTATVNGSAAFGATFNGPFTLQMGNGGGTVNIGTVAGTVTFGGPVQVSLGIGANTLNLAATKLGAVPAAQVIFKQQAVFDGQNGKNTKYVGVNVSGAPQFKNF